MELFILELLLRLLKPLIPASSILLTIVKSWFGPAVVLRNFSTFEVLFDIWYFELNLLKLALKFFLGFFDFGWGDELFNEIEVCKLILICDKTIVLFEFYFSFFLNIIWYPFFSCLDFGIRNNGAVTALD